MSESPRPRRGGTWRRRLVWTLVFALVVAAAVPVAILGLLRIERVREGIVARASESLERAAGVNVRAEGFDFDPRHGVIVIRGLELAATGHPGEPFLSVSYLRCDLDLRALLEGRLVVGGLEADRPLFRVDAPLPSRSREARGTAGGFVERLEIRSFELRNGGIPDGGRWSLTGLEARGSVSRGRTTAFVSRAGIHLEPASRPIDLGLEGSFTLAPDGAFEVESLEARGAGISFGGEGTGRLSGGFRLEASYRLDADLARLAGDLFSRGSVGASGRLGFGNGRGLAGTARFEAREVPLDALERWISVELPPAFNPRGTQADATGDLELDFSDFRSFRELRGDRIRGEASLAWRRGGVRLLDASVRAEPEAPGSNEGISRCSFRASAFPADEGVRTLEGKARIRSWGDPATFDLSGTALRLVEPRIAGALERLGFRVRWPDAARPDSSLECRIEAGGPLASPRIRLDATWRDEREIFAVVSARSVPGWRAWPDGKLALDVEASILPDAPGSRHARGRLDGLELRDGIARVDLPDLGQAVTDLLRSAGMSESYDPSRFEGSLSGPLHADARFSGSVTGPRVEVESSWHPGGRGAVRLHAIGRPTGHPPYFDFEEDATIEAREVEGGPFGADGVVVHALLARSNGRRVEVRRIAATLPPRSPEAIPAELSGTGSFDLAWLPSLADFDLKVEHPVGGVDCATARLRLDGGVIHLDRLDVESGTTAASARGTIPLTALARFAGPLRERLAAYPSGPVTLEVEGIDLGALRLALPLPAAFPNASGALDLRLAVDPEHPMAASGRLEARDVALELEGRRIVMDAPIRIDVLAGKATLPATPFRTIGLRDAVEFPGTISGTAEISPDWSPERDLASLIGRFSVDLHGTLEASTLTRILKTGTATGNLTVEASARGASGAFTADVAVSGPGATIAFRSPYATRFESPEARLAIRDGALVIESARARWNAGELSIRGTVAPRGDSDVTADFDGVSYRLAYGVTMRLGGRLHLLWPADGERTLGGSVNVDHAALRRNVALDRELLRSLFEPAAGTVNPLLESLQADLLVSTTRGLRIKNNLADLSADWDPLQVTGSLAAPKISGQARVAPGGLLNLFGSIVRIDEATFAWSADPPSSPRITMTTTSAIEDPSIKNLWYSSWYQAPVQGPGRGGSLELTAQRASTSEVAEAFTSGMMTYYQDRLAGAVGGDATQTELSYEPLPLFGETDTTARMTITQRLSRYAKFVASYSPVDAEAKTFILEAHGLEAAPSLSAQVFTNDEKHEGATLQQTIRLGRGYEPVVTDRLRKVRIEAPDGVSKRKLKRAVTYHPGDPLAEEAALETEIDVVEAMTQLGYPLSEVSVATVPHAPRRIDLEIRVVPGPKVRCKFEGNKPVKAARRAIAALYRFGDEEAASLEEIRRETARALQTRGYLSPRVEAWVDERADAGTDGAAVTLRVRGEGGRKIDPEAPRFLGVGSEEAAALAALFRTREARVALAASSPAADSRVTRTLAAAGYPNARLASRELSENGRELVVRVEPGERLRVATLSVRGLPPEDEERIVPLLGIRAGDPVVTERIARAVVVVERDLRSKGHAQASVRARIGPGSPDRPFDRALVVDVSPGPRFEIAGVKIEGQRTSKTRWIESTAGLSSGSPADPQDISKARTRLAQTGVFEEIRVTTDPPTAPAARAEGTPDPGLTIPTTVSFDLAERKRWQLGYGGRYESEVGFGVMINLDNFNSLGRGHTTGVRGIYGQEHQEVHAYHMIPRIFGERSSLEGFIQWKKELEEGVWSEGEQAWLQASFPLTTRWRNRVYAVVEHRELTSEDPDTPLDQRAISPRFGWQIAYDTRVLPSDGRVSPKGFFYGLNLVGSSETLGSDLTSLGTYQQWTHYLPIGDPERSRFHWGHSYRMSTINVKDESVPTDSRLRAGGEFSVRGFPTNSLGPQDADGNATGGEFLLLANEELHVRFWKTLSGLLFVDLGNVWPTLADFDGRFSASYGVGLRWSSPIGPLRLDWARPINPREGDKSDTLYFGFGNVF